MTAAAPLFKENTVNVSQWEKHILDENGKLCRREMLFENGVTKLETPYHLGRKHGLEKFYDMDGALLVQTPFVMNRVEGNQRFFYKSGKPKAEKNYFNDVATHQKFYSENGSLIKTHHYCRGHLSKVEKNGAVRDFFVDREAVCLTGSMIDIGLLEKLIQIPQLRL